jgi:hypothetical protein
VIDATDELKGKRLNMKKPLSDPVAIGVSLEALALLPEIGHAQTLFFSDDFESDNFDKWFDKGEI